MYITGLTTLVIGIPVSIKLIIITAAYFILAPVIIGLTTETPSVIQEIDLVGYVANMSNEVNVVTPVLENVSTVITTLVDDVISPPGLLDVLSKLGDSVMPKGLFPNLFFGLSPKIVIENLGYSFVFFVKHLFYSCPETTTIYPISNIISILNYTEWGIIKKIKQLKDAFFVIKPHYTAQYFISDGSINFFRNGRLNMAYLKDNNIERTLYCIRNGYTNCFSSNE
jgi:hypothetical protein